MRPILEDASGYVHGLPGEHPVPFTWKCDDVSVLVDPLRLGQALRSVLNNAARYSPTGSPVQLHCHASDHGFIQMVVDDRGLGIPREDRERVLGKYERGSAAPHSPGHGLGLYIARRIAEARRPAVPCRPRRRPGHPRRPR